MTAQQIKALVSRLPEPERREAAKRVLLAVRGGWTIFGYWECLANYPTTQWDLVGITPTGDFEFLPDLKKLS